MMKRVCTPVAAHRRWLSKDSTDTVSWLSQSTDIFTKFNEVNMQLQGIMLTSLKPNQQSLPSCPGSMLFKQNRARHELKIMNSNSFQLVNELIY